ncbi:hypothetical protein J437_LFUL012668 [Ladona fulva]|uniref:DnaJ homolog subfamily C member 1 n=1 Tax=Ladona fulva TaxID=123851 RepID=A0A8K0KDN0_LADFU|nr:hypothetical protein J437_LFUL012668 [Ladona fulva]
MGDKLVPQCNKRHSCEMEDRGLLLRLLMLCTFVTGVFCWDNEDLEIFDLVEEVNTNFYQLLEVSEDSNLTEIKKAFRRLSLNTHPDKSDAPDAEIRFRQLVAVYDVLKDSNKREKYNLVLKNGLPNWHEAVYYYRRVRKMGLLEMIIILLVITTLGHYIVSWAAYMEKKYFAEQFISSKLKKIQKKQKKVKVDGVLDTLPLQLIRFLWFCIQMCPQCFKYLRDSWVEWRLRANEPDVVEEEEADDGSKEKRVRRRKVFELPEIKEDDIVNANESTPTFTEVKPTSMGTAPISGGLWTEDDLAELVKQIKRHPPGTADRWEKIASAMFRSVPEVTFMARKVKEEGYRAGAVSSATEDGSLEKPKKVKTKGGKLGKLEEEGQLVVVPNNNCGTPEIIWSQTEQKALENALIKYPKGTLERWEKIAKCVPGKTKEECMLRYKVLVELVKKRKEDKSQVSEEKDAEL